MAVFIVETDAAGVPTDPVTGWHGPLELEVEVDWIAQETDADDDPIIVPEIDWPTCRHLRRVDWCHTGVRPPRALPRGLRITLVSVPTASGDEPPGVIGEPLECWSSDPIGADRNVADYDDNDGMLPRTTWEMRTDSAAHTTLQDPNLYITDDYILSADARYRASDGTHWRLFSTNPDWLGEYAPSSNSPRCLAIAQQDFAPPTTKTRSVVFEDPYHDRCPPGHVWPPQIWLSEDLSLGKRVALADGGVLSLEFVMEEVSSTPGHQIRIVCGTEINFNATIATWIFNATPPIGWVIQFAYTGGAFAYYLDAVAGQTIRLEVDRGVTPNTLRWFVDGGVEFDINLPILWGSCNTGFSTLQTAFGGFTRGDALIEDSRLP